MKRLLLLGSSLVSIEIVQIARKMGCYTIVTDNLKPEQSTAKKVADEYWMISTDDLDELEKKCKEGQVDAVFAGVSEFNLDRVLELTGRLGLPCYIDRSAWDFARDKEVFKHKCKEFGIPVVDEYSLSNPPATRELQMITYPVVVKPVDGAGNRGLSICHNEEELVAGLTNARASSNSGQIVVEKYIRGSDYWYFYFLAGGVIRYSYSGTGFSEPGYPSFLYSFCSSAVKNLDYYKYELNSKCVELLRNIGCRDGMAWIQFIRDKDGNYYALEMAHRLSAGAAGSVLEKMNGVNTVEWMLETALGIKHKPEDLPREVNSPYKMAHCVFCQFAARPGRITSFRGYEDLDPEKYEVSFVAHEGTDVPKYRLLARISFAAESGHEICDMLREINNRTQILNENNEDFYIHYTDYQTVEEYHKNLFIKE